MKYLFFVVLVFGLFSCNSQQEAQENQLKTVYPEKIYQGSEIKIVAPFDSLSIDTDTLFFNVVFYFEDYSRIVQFFDVTKGEVTIKVPEKAAFITGHFYNLEDAEERDYQQIIYNKEGKVAQNAYQLQPSKEILAKEIENHPYNISAYAHYVDDIASGHYFGRFSDTVFYQNAEAYLDSARQKFDKESISHLAAMARLLAYNRNYEPSRECIRQLMQINTSSNHVKEAIDDYNLALLIYEDNGIGHTSFVDSIAKEVAEKYPRSYLGLINSQEMEAGGRFGKYYSSDDIIKNNFYLYQSLETNRIDYLWQNIDEYVKLEQYDSAIFLAESLLEKTSQNYGIHQNPISKDLRKEIKEKTKEGYMANAYYHLHEINLAKRDTLKAMEMLDSTTRLHKVNSIATGWERTYNYFALLQPYFQRKLGMYDEALETYEAVYKERQEAEVLDSIRVLFRETEQEDGFDAYVKNLRERLDSGNQQKELAPDFAIKDMSGYEIKLSDWKDRVVVINFWANYCIPCIREIPHLNQLWRNTQSEDIIFLAATRNTPLEVERFARRQEEMYGFVVLPNADKLFRVYDIYLMPTTIIIDKSGKVVHQEIGFSGDIDNLKSQIEKQLEL